MFTNYVAFGGGKNSICTSILLILYDIEWFDPSIVFIRVFSCLVQFWFRQTWCDLMIFLDVLCVGLLTSFFYIEDQNFSWIWLLRRFWTFNHFYFIDFTYTVVTLLRKFLIRLILYRGYIPCSYHRYWSG